MARIEETSAKYTINLGRKGSSTWVVRNEKDERFVTLENLQNPVKGSDHDVEAIRETLKKGLSKKAFLRLKEILNVSVEQLADVVQIPSRTLSRRELFKPDESERILRVALVFQRALEVMGDEEKARKWFFRPQQSLGGNTPFEFCDTEPGADEVKNLLGRIEHGVF